MYLENNQLQQYGVAILTMSLLLKDTLCQAWAMQVIWLLDKKCNPDNNRSEFHFYYCM
jgi:hypothetical protein